MIVDAPDIFPVRPPPLPPREALVAFRHAGLGALPPHPSPPRPAQPARPAQRFGVASCRSKLAHATPGDLIPSRTRHRAAPNSGRRTGGNPRATAGTARGDPEPPDARPEATPMNPGLRTPARHGPTRVLGRVRPLGMDGCGLWRPRTTGRTTRGDPESRTTNHEPRTTNHEPRSHGATGIRDLVRVRGRIAPPRNA